MKNSPLATVLLALLACAALGSLILCWMYIHSTRQLRAYQGNVAGIQQRQQAFQFLINDVVEYSKRNPQIDPILEKNGIKLKPGATNNSSAKNASK